MPLPVVSLGFGGAGLWYFSGWVKWRGCWPHGCQKEGLGKAVAFDEHFAGIDDGNGGIIIRAGVAEWVK